MTANSRRIVGTAGHIDHGKTSLVRALTGIDADRLPEEKRRGITIDLGFAHWSSGELQIGFIDVPGHERFVKNMLAGVGGIDSVLLVVAADESIMPQTREHFDICRLLGISQGVIAITKRDAVEADVIDVVKLEVADLVRGSFLEGKPMIAVSSTTGEGLEELRTALIESVEASSERDAEKKVFRLPIDRVFTLKGFGTVVTGTTVSGTIARDTEVEVLPDRLQSNVRSIEVHAEGRDQAAAGERTSLNLSDLQLDQLYRGQQLVRPGTLTSSQIMTVQIELLATAPPLKDQARVRFHHYAAEVLGSVRLFGDSNVIEPGARGVAQIRLEKPVVAIAGDRFVLRRYSPMVTIGGGRVLEAQLGKLARNTRSEILSVLRDGSLRERAELLARLAGLRGISLKELVAHSGMVANAVAPEIRSSKELVETGDNIWVHREVLTSLEHEAMNYLSDYFNRNRVTTGLPKSELAQKLLAGIDPRRADFFVTHLQKQKIVVILGDRLDVPGRSKNLSGVEGELARTIEERFKSAGLQTPAVSELINTIQQKAKVIEGVINFLVKSDVLVRLAEGVYVHRTNLDEARVRLAPHKGEENDVAWFKEFFQISRKIVIPLLEFLDRKGVTRRQGDRRLIL